MKKTATGRIWPPSRSELKNGLIWYIVILVAFIGLAAFKEIQKETTPDIAYIIFFGAFGATSCFLFLLILIYYPLKIIPRISQRAEDKGKERSATRGRIITVWAIRLYIFAMIAVNVARSFQYGGKGWVWSLFWIILTCWLFSAVKQGMKPAKDFMSFLLILGAFSAFSSYQLIGENSLAVYYLLFSIYGVILGLTLLLSQDVGYYLSQQYEKLPNKIKDKLNKK